MFYFVHTRYIPLYIPSSSSVKVHGPLTRYAKLRVVHAPGMPGTFSLPPRVSDPDMHHITCVTHVPWCMPGSVSSDFLWSRWRGEIFPAQAQPVIWRIWQEAHGLTCDWLTLQIEVTTLMKKGPVKIKAILFKINQSMYHHCLLSRLTRHVMCNYTPTLSYDFILIASCKK